MFCLHLPNHETVYCQLKQNKQDKSAKLFCLYIFNVISEKKTKKQCPISNIEYSTYSIQYKKNNFKIVVIKFQYFIEF